MTLLHQAAQKAVEALKAAQRAINSMKVEAETAAAGGDEQMLQDACETISAEGLEADTELRDAIAQLSSALQHQEEPREPVAHYEQMRLTLIGQVHELLDIAERHAWTKDPEEKRRTEGAIAHARKVTAPYNYNGATSPSTTRQQEVGSFQQRVEPWLLACFGEAIAADHIERNHRFLEESLELVQACGCTVSEAHQLVYYVYGRPVGEKRQEAGGVMVTLAALCRAQAIDMHAEGERELARIWTMVEKIRAKQAAKPKHSPLPEVSAPSTPEKAGGVSDGVAPSQEGRP